jgi:hypothetical protein
MIVGQTAAEKIAVNPATEYKIATALISSPEIRVRYAINI